MAHAAIELEHVHVTYRTRDGLVEALRDISLRVEPNAFLTVVGPSGCGKTTLLKIVSGVLRPSRGRILLFGEDLSQARLEGKFGFVFQRPLLLPWRTALGNVALTSEIVAKQLSREQRLERAREWLGLTGLQGFEDKYPHELSGGMQQRVALSRALSFHPQILLMDEPFAALDEITREAMQGELLKIWARIRSTILFVTHSIAEALLLSDRVVILSHRPGEILETLDIPFERPRAELLRGQKEFVELVEHVRSKLRGPEGQLG
ncbi:MAG: ABC transporter ATP-binding protein [Deltaproteobacteria bacterium]|nr:ABC transporter ATP-binding protein [Deltaproteobacteria bacterium]